MVRAEAMMRAPLLMEIPIVGMIFEALSRHILAPMAMPAIAFAIADNIGRRAGCRDRRCDQRHRTGNQEFPTVLGPDAKFKGELSFEKGMRVMGQFEGKITTPGRIHIAKEAKINTDDAPIYRHLDPIFPNRESVNHSKKEYVRGEVHTNTVEGYFSIFKRGMRGVYQHCSEKHLHRYWAEFDFRYSNRVALGVNDEQRASKAVEGVVGKRLTYRPTGSRA